MAESVMLGLLATNTVINVIQSSSIIERVQRWIRLFNSQLISVAKEQNEAFFFQVTKYLHKHASLLQHRTMISYGDDKNTYVFLVPDKNSEIKIQEPYGNIWIKSISLDQYKIFAYEITCRNQNPKVINRFIYNILLEIQPPLPKDELDLIKHLFKLDEPDIWPEKEHNEYRERHYLSCWSKEDEKKYDEYCYRNGITEHVNRSTYIRRPSKGKRYKFFIFGPYKYYYIEF